MRENVVGGAFRGRDTYRRRHRGGEGSVVRCFWTKIAAIWRALGHFTRPNVAPIKIALVLGGVRASLDCRLMIPRDGPAFGHGLLDLSPFDGMPPASVTRLAHLFYRSDSPASGLFQLNAIEASSNAGESLDYKLHQMAGASMQAGAAQLGRIVRSYREDPDTMVTTESLAALRALLERTAEELQSLGILAGGGGAVPTSPGGGQPQPEQKRPGSSGSSSGSDDDDVGATTAAFQQATLNGLPNAQPNDPANEPLLDLSSYDGLPQPVITRLATHFYLSDVPGGARSQINELETKLLAGEDGTTERVLYLLHQLAGSSLQAGAGRLGKTSRSFRESPDRPLTLAGIGLLRSIVGASCEELRALGHLPAA